MGAFVFDSFTDISGTSLLSHAGELGAVWTEAVETTGNVAISDAGRARAVDGSTSDMFASGSPGALEYDITGGFLKKTTIGTIGMMARARLTGPLHCFLSLMQSDSVRVYKVIEGSFTQLGTFAFTVNADQVYVVLFQVRNATKKAFVDGVQRVSSADDTITVVGAVGVRAQFGSNTTGYHLESFLAEDLPAPSYVPPRRPNVLLRR